MNFEPPPPPPVRDQPRPAPRRVPTRLSDAAPFQPIAIPSPEELGVPVPVIIPSPDDLQIK